MTTYAIPDDPQCTVWSLNGLRFDYNPGWNRYYKTDAKGGIKRIRWDELVYLYGPLTDVSPDTPAISEVFSGPRHFSTLPDHGIFRRVDSTSVATVAVCRHYGPNEGGISYTNSTRERDELWEGTWERIA